MPVLQPLLRLNPNNLPLKTPSGTASFAATLLVPSNKVVFHVGHTQAPITVPIVAFEDVLNYLQTHAHNMHSPCQIRSNNNSRLAGPLCLIARQHTNNVRCINYVLPLLAKLGWVDIDSRVPNTVWLLKPYP
jgi:hypothetical protein